MSRVIKLQPGGEVPKPANTFEWAGNQYNQDALFNEYSKKRQDWLSKSNYNQKEQELFNQGFNQVAKMLQTPGIKRNPDGSWSNSAGVNSSGQIDKNIIGGIKRNDNNAIGMATAFLDDIMSSMPTYTAYSKKEEPKRKERFNINLKEAVTKKYMPGGYDASIWEKYDTSDNQTNERGNVIRQQKLTSVVDDLINQVSTSDFDTNYELPSNISDKNQWLEKLKNAKEKLSDGTLNDADYTSLAEAGLNGLDELLGNIVNVEKILPGETPEQRMGRVKNEATESDWVNFINQTKKGDQSKQWGIKLRDTLEQLLPKQDSRKTPMELFKASIPDVRINQSTLDNPIPVNIPLNRNLEARPSDKTGMASLRNNIEKYIETDPRAKNFMEGDFVYIMPTLSRDRQYILRYNNKTNTAQRVLITESPKVMEYVKQGFLRERDPNIANRSSEFKEGGIVKMQKGDVFDEMESEYQTNLKTKKVQTEQKTKQEAQNKTQAITPIEETTRKPSDGWEWDDYTRLGAISSDIMGLAAGFVPGGSLVSAGSGFVSTGANFAADMKNGFQLSDLGNAGLSLGMDALSVIPGLGIAAKGSKIAKNIIKWAPRLMAAWAASNNTEPAIKSLSKLTNSGWNSLTVDDWRNISNGIHLIVSGGRGAKRQIQAGKLAHNLETGNMQVRTDKGFSVLSPEQLSTLKSKKGLEAQNEYLKQLGIEGSLETKFGGKWFNPTRNFNNPQTIKDYNLDKPKIKMTSSGEVVVNRTPAEKLIISNMQRNAPTIPNFIPENLKNKINDVRYSGATKVAEAMPNMNKIRVTLSRQLNKDLSKLTNAEILSSYKEHISTASLAAAKKEIKSAINPEIIPKKQKIKNVEIIKDKGGEELNLIKEKAKAKFEQKKLDENWAQMEAKKAHKENSPEQIYRNTKKQLEAKPINYQSIIDARYKSTIEDRVSRMLPWLEVKKNGGKLRRFQLGGAVYTGPNNPTDNLQVSAIERKGVFDKAFKQWQISNPGRGIDEFIQEVVNPYQKSYNTMGNNPTAIRNHQTLTMNNPLYKLMHDQTTYNLAGLLGRDPETDPRYASKTGNNIDSIRGSRTNEYHYNGLDIPGYTFNVQTGEYEKLLSTASTVNSPLVSSIGNSLNIGLNPMVATQQPGNQGLAIGTTAKQPRNLQFLPEDAIAAGRMIGTVATNNWANRRMQRDLRPTLIDTYENYVPQTEDYLAKTSAYNNAAELQRQAGRIASGTSDASLGAAALLQGTSQGNQIRFQGDMANSQRLYQTGEQARGESNAAKARRVEVANKNKGAMNQISFAKAQMDAQTRAGNWMQAIQPWAAGIENRIRTNRGIQKQVDLESAQLNSQIKYADDMQKIQRNYSDKYKGWLDAGNKGTQQDWLTANPTEYEGYNTSMFNLQSKSRLDAIKDKSLLGRGSLLLRPLGQYSQYKARGGKFSAKDTSVIERAKDFNKSMREQQKNFLKELQSIRKENSQMMRHVSSFTAQLIKSGMSWK